MPKQLTSEQQRDATLIRHPGSWPGWPYLPLTKAIPNADKQLGTMLAGEGYGSTIFLVNMYSMPRNKEDFDGLPRKVYNSAEDIVLDGWKID